MLDHVTISIYGKVQGVFFRRTVKHEAGRLGIAGFIENQPDGSVRIEAEAEEAVLKEFAEWIKSGAGEGMHSVGQVDVEKGRYQGLKEFRIVE